MAYFSQQDKAKVSPAIKAVFKKYRVKGSIGVHNHTSLVVNIKSGALDFCGALKRIREEQVARRGERHDLGEITYIQVNRYHVEQWHREAGEHKIADFFKELIEAMLGADWYDNSDSMMDYFDTAYYMDINVGKWNKPYQLVK